MNLEKAIVGLALVAQTACGSIAQNINREDSLTDGLRMSEPQVPPTDDNVDCLKALAELYEQAILGVQYIGQLPDLRANAAATFGNFVDQPLHEARLACERATGGANDLATDAAYDIAGLFDSTKQEVQ